MPQLVAENLGGKRNLEPVLVVDKPEAVPVFVLNGLGLLNFLPVDGGGHLDVAFLVLVDAHLADAGQVYTIHLRHQAVCLDRRITLNKHTILMANLFPQLHLVLLCRSTGLEHGKQTGNIIAYLCSLNGKLFTVGGLHIQSPFIIVVKEGGHTLDLYP